MNFLVVDDEVTIRELVGELLEAEGHNVTLAENGEDALRKFKLVWHEVVFCDIRMPKMNGIELLAEVKNINPSTQFVIMTSHASVDNSVQALKKGAFDYILKPFDNLDIIVETANRATLELSAARRQEALVNTLARQNQELDDLNKEFRELAIRDGLTGLFNHRYAHERLEQEFERATRFARDLTVIFIDVDNFKFFNDTNGHQAGDTVLKILASIMTNASRESDTVARWGGEEFILVAPETDADTACKLAEKIRQAVAAYPFPHAAEQPLGCISLSLGVAAKSSSTASPQKLLRHADDAVYRAKDAGRNRTVFCSSPAKLRSVG
jgi:diguanylate cyclase (GGDEF)-like protein